jgi:hypothetical protein
MTATVESPVTATPRAREWSWWLNDLDNAVGPIVAGRVYVIGARPSCGKTALLMNLFRHIGPQIEDGVFLTSWTERSQVAARTSIAALMEGWNEDLTLRGAWDQLPKGAEKQCRAWVQGFERDEEWLPMLDMACPSADDIGEAIAKHNPNVFLLDYLQKVRPVGRQTTFDAWLATMTHCTQLAADGGTVIIGSQLKRKGDGVFDKYRPPFMEDFKGGGAIEEGANLALGLYRPLSRMTNAEEREAKTGRSDLLKWQQPGVMAIKVLKHTFWGTAADRIVRARVHPTTRRITDYSSRAPVDQGDAYESDEAPF